MNMTDTSEGLVPPSIILGVSTRNKIGLERTSNFFRCCESIYNLLTGGMPNLSQLEIVTYAEKNKLLNTELLSTLPNGSELLICISETGTNSFIDCDISVSIYDENSGRNNIIAISPKFISIGPFIDVLEITVELEYEDIDLYCLNYGKDGNLQSIRFMDSVLEEELALHYVMSNDLYKTVNHNPEISIAVEYVNRRFGDIIFPYPIDIWGTVQSVVQGSYKNILGNIMPRILYK